MVLLAVWNLISIFVRGYYATYGTTATIDKRWIYAQFAINFFYLIEMIFQIIIYGPIYCITNKMYMKLEFLIQITNIVLFIRFLAN